MIEPAKDPDREHPIADAWRSVFRAIVHAFVEGDWALARGVPSVDPVDPDLAARIQEYVADYGETLTELTEATWSRSVAQWYGSHWQVLVDLCTVAEGVSDLVLAARVYETDDGYRFAVHLVYVP